MSEETRGRGEIVLVGTAHVAEGSVEEVRRRIGEEDPDVVAVELDENRYNSLKGETREDLDPKDMIQGTRPVEFLVYWLLSYLQNKLGDEFGIEPGADMMAAIEEAEDRDIPIALVDRDIQVTVQRLWSKMRFVEKLKFVGALLLGLAGFGDAEEVDVEELAEGGDLVEALIEEFREISPHGAEALIDERDAYIASHLIALRERGDRVVAVVGAGHEAGIRRYLEDPSALPDIDELEQASGGRRFSPFKIVGYLISVFIVGMFVLLFMAGASNATLARLFVYWFLINGVLAFAGAKLAGGHWTSASVGGLVAWMTSINPALAPGWFAGYVELRYVDVAVTDIDDINEILSDTTASTLTLLRRMYRVPVFRLLMVVAFTNLGSIVGTALFVAVVVPGADVDMTAMLSEGIGNSWDGLVGGVRALTGL